MSGSEVSCLGSRVTVRPVGICSDGSSYCRGSRDMRGSVKSSIVAVWQSGFVESRTARVGSAQSWFGSRVESGLGRFLCVVAGQSKEL